ncbi:MAG TPA: dihydrolipoyl dehydrogenase [Candidatus Mcinerneyibacteriales bacterium]|nr:dihydrolipoyl dehydrogenase [Candidatus Mcinerneyibacteriales bacterium]HPE20395.1 dihydrolipoyl dehydrogenase [Candidatus Mcinerneyibacteriales bacterium]HPJ69544.1 dihydrolipoyl dehydrogenase [Candidatus Mcinerneyibacteriales bacterium]HPQ89794.1 dihydrolipoyl dehydrogenase [Candidatus Mcinerneyibacteriales bacterium]
MKDLIIIGAGPGGYVAAIRAVQLGLDVALVEKGRVGGTCLNVGCIPTKTYVAMAELYAKMQEASHFGIDLEGTLSLNFRRMVERKDEVVDQLVRGIERILQKRKIEVIPGEGRLTGPGSVEVAGKSFQARNIILATGSEPVIPGFLNIPDFTVDSTALLDCSEPLSSLAVIGGGVVGVEFASIWAHLGTKVSLIEIQPSLLPTLDKKIGTRLKSMLKKKGVEVFTSRKAEKVAPGEIILDDGTVIRAEKMLVAIGRRPVLKGIDTEKLGIRTENGFITVSETMETSLKGVYAIGDLLASPQLAHVASKEGIVAVENIAGIKSRVNYNAIPWAVFTHPEIAVVGASEGAREGKFPFSANGKALGAGESEGYVRIVADEEGKVTGMEIIGPHASDLIHEGALAVANGLTLEEVAETVHAHPTLSEAVAEAAEGALLRAIHLA